MLHTSHQPSARDSTSSVARMGFSGRAGIGTGSDGRSSRASSSLMGMDKARSIASSGRGGAGNIKNAQVHGEGRPLSFYPVDQTSQITGVEVLTNTSRANTNSGRGGSGNIRRKVTLPSDSQTAAIISQYEKTTLEYEHRLMAESAAKRAEAARAIGRGGAGARKKKPKKKSTGSLHDSYGVTSTTILTVSEHGSEPFKSFGQTVRDKLRLRKKKQLPPTTMPGYEASLLSTIVDISIPFPEDPYSPPPSASLAAPGTLHPWSRARSQSQHTITDGRREAKEIQCPPSFSAAPATGHPALRMHRLAADTASIPDSTWSFHRSPSIPSSRIVTSTQFDEQRSPTTAENTLSRMNSPAFDYIQQSTLLSPKDPHFTTHSLVADTSRRSSYATTTSYATTNSYATTATQSSYTTSYTSVSSLRRVSSCLPSEQNGEGEDDDGNISGHDNWTNVQTTPATWLQSSAGTPRPRRSPLKAQYCAGRSLDGRPPSTPTSIAVQLDEDIDQISGRLSVLPV